LDQGSAVTNKGLGMADGLKANSDLFVFKFMREYEKTRLPWMRSVEDRDLLTMIGLHQGEGGNGITCKQLYLTGIEPIATMQRRLKRLIDLGIVRKSRSAHDARVHYLALSEPAKQLLQSYAACLSARGN